MVTESLLNNLANRADISGAVHYNKKEIGQVNMALRQDLNEFDSRKSSLKEPTQQVSYLNLEQVIWPRTHYGGMVRHASQHN